MNPLEDKEYQERLTAIENAHVEKANKNLAETDKKIEFEDKLKKFKEIKERTIVSDNIDWDAIAQDAKEIERKNSATFTVKDLLNINFPPTVWLVDKLIPAEGFTAITGAPASYKSFITEHLAVCIASGSSFLGTIPVSQGAVLIIDKENPLSLLKERFVKMGIAGDPPVHFLQAPDKFELMNDEHLKWIINYIKENKIKLVILDSFSHIHRGDENDSMAVVKTFERLKQFHCATIFIHHHRKSIKFFTGTVLETIRGSSDIGAEVESHLALDVVSTGIKVTQSKNRRAELAKPFIIIPLITEDSIKFEHGGEMEEEVSKREEAKDLIGALFLTKKRWLRQDIIVSLEGKIGQRTVADILKNYVKEGLLIEDWEGQKRVYVGTEDFCKGLLQGLLQNAEVQLSASQQSYQEEADRLLQ